MNISMHRNDRHMDRGIVMHSGRTVGTYRLASREAVEVSSRSLLKDDEVWVVDFTVAGQRFAGAGTRPCFAMIAAQEG